MVAERLKYLKVKLRPSAEEMTTPHLGLAWSANISSDQNSARITRPFQAVRNLAPVVACFRMWKPSFLAIARRTTAVCFSTS